MKNLKFFTALLGLLCLASACDSTGNGFNKLNPITNTGNPTSAATGIAPDPIPNPAIVPQDSDDEIAPNDDPPANPPATFGNFVFGRGDLQTKFIKNLYPVTTNPNSVIMVPGLSQSLTVIPRLAPSCEKGQILNSDGKCICDTENYKEVEGQCLQKIEAFSLRIKTIDLDNGVVDGNTKDEVEFDLCPSNYVDSRCFKVILKPDLLKKGPTQKIVLSAGHDNPNVQVLPSFAPLSDLDERYQYFRFVPKGQDAWGLAGVELRVKKKGASGFTAIYRNPCVNRWIATNGTSTGSGFTSQFGNSLGFLFNVSEHGPNDEAFCAYVKTCNEEDAGTYDRVSLNIPRIYGDDSTRIDLNWSYSIPGVSYDDFREGKARVYGKTFYDRANVHEELFNFKTDGSDSWKMCENDVYHFNPASRPFLKDQTCMGSIANFPITLNAERDPTGISGTLREQTCTGFDTISWAGDKDGSQFLSHRNAQ